MYTKTLFLSIFLVCLLIGIGFSGCDCGDPSPTDPDPALLLDQDVTVLGGGGGVDVPFSASSGQTIQITMTTGTAVNSNLVIREHMEPYGYLTYPDGTGGYYPSQETIKDGSNSVKLELTQTGTYTLSVMDGSGQGGTVHVKVEVL